MKISEGCLYKRKVIKDWLMLIRMVGLNKGLTINYLLKKEEFLYLEIKGIDYDREKPSYCLPIHNTDWGFDCKGFYEFYAFFRKHNLYELIQMLSDFKKELRIIAKTIKMI